MNNLQFASHSHESLIQTEAYLHADDKQVQSIGKGEAQATLTRLDPPVQPYLRNQVPEKCCQEQNNKWAEAIYPTQQYEHNQENGRQYFHTAKGENRVRPAVSGSNGHELPSTHCLSP